MTTDLDTAVIFPARIKEEPSAEYFDVNGVNSASFESQHCQKPAGKRPKPTWSLKELSDDEGGRCGEADDSSEYEPSSPSDSDSERESKKSSVSGHKRMKFSVFSEEDASFSPTWFQPVPSTNNSHKNSPPSNQPIAPFRKQLKLQANENKTAARSPPTTTMTHKPLMANAYDFSDDRFVAASKCGRLIYLIRQLQDINRASHTDAENHYRCKPVFESIFQQIRKYSFLKSSVVAKQLKLLANVVRRRKSQGNSVANQVHFSLVSKQLIELIHTTLNHATEENLKKKLEPTRIEEDGSPKFVNLLKSGNSRDSNSNQLETQYNSTGHIPLLASSFVQSFSLKKTTIPKLSSTSCTETPIYTIDDDDQDESTPTVENVTTLREKSNHHYALLSSFEHWIATIMVDEIPKPVCKDRENEVSWMGYQVAEGDSGDLHVADYRCNAIALPAQYPLSPKYPPNVPVTCETVNSPVVLFQTGKIKKNQSLLEKSDTSVNSLTQFNYRNGSSAICKNRQATPFSPVNRQPTQDIRSPDIIVISDSDDDDSKTASTLVNLPTTTFCSDASQILYNADASNMSTHLDGGLTTISDEELVLGL